MNIQQLLDAAAPASRYVPTATAELITGLANAVRQLTKQHDDVIASLRAGASEKAIKAALDECSEFLDRDCIMELNDISYEDAAQREIGAMALHNALLRQGATK